MCRVGTKMNMVVCPRHRGQCWPWLRAVAVMTTSFHGPGVCYPGASWGGAEPGAHSRAAGRPPPLEDGVCPEPARGRWGGHAVQARRGTPAFLPSLELREDARTQRGSGAAGSSSLGAGRLPVRG